jgi:hypothetical protein
MKKLYLFLNKHMKTVAVCLAACLIPVAVVPALGYVVAAAMLVLCLLMYLGDYPFGWIWEA